MGSFTEDAYLREKVHSLHAGLLCRLDEYVEAFPRGQSRDLIGTIRLFLSEIDDEVSTCNDLEVIRWFCRLIDELAEVLEWLDDQVIDRLRPLWDETNLDKRIGSFLAKEVRQLIEEYEQRKDD